MELRFHLLAFSAFFVYLSFAVPVHQVGTLYFRASADQFNFVVVSQFSISIIAPDVSHVILDRDGECVLTFPLLRFPGASNDCNRRILLYDLNDSPSCSTIWATFAWLSCCM
eukprot:Em0001g3236a